MHYPDNHSQLLTGFSDDKSTQTRRLLVNLGTRMHRNPGGKTLSEAVPE